MRRLAITHDPHGTQWELHAAPGRFPVLLAGWVLSGEEREEPEVPRWAAELLCRVWCEAALVTFLLDARREVTATGQWRMADGSWWCRPERRRFSVCSRIPDLELCATSSAGVAERLFADDVFCWQRRGQRVFLSTPPDPPGLDRSAIHPLLRRPARIDASALRSAGVWGLVFPGVDGDFAEMVTFAEEDREHLYQAFREVCSAMHVPLDVLSEAEFTTNAWTR